ncbi:FAGR140Cp [Eremothecium gossypii FDAG1]|nr:FAGR140Cp [Eremothecium gossypii FDAG1]
MAETNFNYSKLLRNLVTEDNVLNEVVVSFLYQLFPRDLFVRAFSLLESADMFIYVWMPTPKEADELLESLYNGTPLYRPIVRPRGPDDRPVCVDLDHWFCSCTEFAATCRPHLVGDTPLSDALFRPTEAADPDDCFGMLAGPQHLRADPEKLMCEHLFAFAILLQTDLRVLRHFSTGPGAQVFVLGITSIDEWLKLHLNVV